MNEVKTLPKGAGEWRKFVHDLGSFDAAFDLQGLLKSGLPVGYARAKEKYGYHWQREGSWLFTSAVEPRPTSIHVVDQYIDVTVPAGGDPGPASFGLKPPPESTESVTKKLKDRGWSGTAPVIFNCGAGWSTKRWPPESFAKLADFVRSRDIPVVFIGTQKEQSIVAAVQDSMQHDSISIAGETSISELVSLLSLGCMHVAGDTGSIHIAAALGIPCIGVYTLTNPARSAPYGQQSRCHSQNVDDAMILAAEVLT